jgi:signal transduction histidine kinase
MSSAIKSLSKRVGLFVHSIRFRLAVWFVLILGIVVTAFSGFIYIRQVRDLRATAVARLELKARRLGGFLRFASREYFQQTPLLLPNDPSSGISILQEGDMLAYIAPDGQVIKNWGPVDASSVQRLAGGLLKDENASNPSLMMIYARPTVDDSRNPYVVLLAPILIDDTQVGYFIIGNPVDPGNQLPRLLISLILGTFVTLGIALFGGVWLADRAMRPVKTITHAAQTIGETDLSLRLNLDRKDELGELADTFDAMLARLEVAFERQRQFTADASHELRTPLTIIDLETSRALASHRNQGEYERVLKVIKSENQFMIQMVTNLLTLARMDAGQVVLQKEELDLSDVTLEVVERLAPLAVNEQVRLSVGDLPELPVLGDRQYLAQMLSNLVGNAIKYSKGEAARVLVEAGSREADGGLRAWVRVVDNGPGIPAEDLSHLFDRFYQVDKSRTRNTSDEAGSPIGVGLGLSIAQWIAQAHGGEISVQSEPGEGSTFEVGLPMGADLASVALRNPSR